MGGLFPKMKITALTMLVGCLAIAGTPLFSGWYSKDAIVAQAFGFAYANPEHGLLFVLPLLTAGITTFYMFRMWFMTFTGEPKDHHVYEHAHESPATMTIPRSSGVFATSCATDSRIRRYVSRGTLKWPFRPRSLRIRRKYGTSSPRRSSS